MGLASKLGRAPGTEQFKDVILGEIAPWSFSRAVEALHLAFEGEFS
ncbi:MAG: hypothetical protein ACRDTW_21940 [Rhodococcus qingshengii]